MAIIISKDGEETSKVEKSSFKKEDSLQKYIYDNPESIPVYDIKEDIQLLILAREFPTNSGPIDAIGIDREGSIYIVETKLYKNADKRKVLAQALDYGAALWKHSNDFNEFISVLDKNVQDSFDLSLNERIKSFFNLSEKEIEQVLNSVKENLSDGVLKFVILMDELDDRLKDLILYVNQNSQFDIYAVELEYYKHKDYEIVIPRIYGTEVKKDINVKTSKKKSWNEESYLVDARNRLDDKVFTNFKKIYNFAVNNSTKYDFGSGQIGSLNPAWHSIHVRSIFNLYTDGRIVIHFKWLTEDLEKFTKHKEGVNDDKIEKFKADFKNIGFDIDDEKARYTSYPEEWSPLTDEFIETVNNLTN